MIENSSEAGRGLSSRFNLPRRERPLPAGKYRMNREAMSAISLFKCNLTRNSAQSKEESPTHFERCVCLFLALGKVTMVLKTF